MALSLGLRPLDVIQRPALWSPDFPPPSPGEGSDCEPRSPRSTVYRIWRGESTSFGKNFSRNLRKKRQEGRGGNIFRESAFFLCFFPGIAGIIKKVIFFPAAISENSSQIFRKNGKKVGIFKYSKKFCKERIFRGSGSKEMLYFSSEAPELPEGEGSLLRNSLPYLHIAAASFPLFVYPLRGVSPVFYCMQKGGPFLWNLFLPSIPVPPAPK